MPLLRNIGLLARCPASGPQADLAPVPDAALAWSNGRIDWVGPEADLPARYRGQPAQDARRLLVVPGLIDCHTHLAFAGWRADEFARRIAGESYQDIARSGGGILSTVRKTRLATTDELLSRARAFLAEMSRLGVTAVECKTGYGLEEATEVRLLEVYRRLAAEGPQRVVATLLAAHAVPPEFRERRAEYLRLITETLIPRAAAMGAGFCDVFVEENAFSLEEAREVLTAGRAAGLRPKLHADQLGTGGGAELGAELGAASADHLEHASEEGIQAMAAAGTVAVSLPLATLYLGQPPMPARRFLEAGCAVAVATDFNPGSAPSYHLPLAMTLACTLQRMTPAEALKGATIVAARAIGIDGETGSLEQGKAADFAIIDAPDVEHWLYHFRPNPCVRTVIAGEDVWVA